jgi:VWFA-related protein
MPVIRTPQEETVMNLRRTGCVVLSCALLSFDPLGLRAQQQPSSSSFGEVFDVRVTNVDVVATDAKGNPIAGLQQADFEIFEDGKKQEITNFYEMTMAQTAAGQQAAGSQPVSGWRPGGAASVRKYIFYVDNGTLSLKNRAEIFTGISDFLTTNLLPGDQAMIVNWTGGALHVRQPWTSDRAALDAALKALAGELGSAGQVQAEKQRAIRTLRQFEAESQGPTPMVTYEVVDSAIRAYADSARHDIGQSVNAVNKLLASLSGVEGKKILIMATESLPTQVGAELFQVFDNIRQRVTTGTAPPPDVYTKADGAPPPGTTLFAGSRRATPISDISKYNVSPLIEGLARTANATGVTVYAINPKGTGNDEAGKADLQESSELNVDFANATQVLDGVNMLTKRTGGVAVIGAPAAMALARLTKDLGSYYSVGYRTRPGTSPDRKIEVRVKRPGVTARYRNSIYYRSLQTEMADRVIANHLQTELTNDLGISLQTEAVKTEGSKKLMPMMIVIPADSLTLLPDAEGNVSGGFSVFTSSGDADGNATGVNVQSQKIKWPPAQAAQMKGRRIGFAVTVPMDKDPKQISVGVVDQVSQVQGFATIKVAK